MTQIKDNVQHIAEFNALFMNLNEKGQDAALTVLRSLNFAQSVMYLQRAENHRTNKPQVHKGGRQGHGCNRDVG